MCVAVVQDILVVLHQLGNPAAMGIIINEPRMIIKPLLNDLIALRTVDALIGAEDLDAGFGGGSIAPVDHVLPKVPLLAVGNLVESALDLLRDAHRLGIVRDDGDAA